MLFKQPHNTATVDGGGVEHSMIAVAAVEHYVGTIIKGYPVDRTTDAGVPSPFGNVASFKDSL